MRINEFPLEYYSPAGLCWLLSGSAWEDNTRVPPLPDNDFNDIENLAQAVFAFSLFGMIAINCRFRPLLKTLQKCSKNGKKVGKNEWLNHG